jgi:mercuric ion binding protein
MKKLIFAIAIFATIGLTTAYSQTHKETMKTEKASVSMTTFGVRGNCNMCKSTIEKAANSVKGVSKANWNKDKKMMMVSFDSSKTNELKIQKAVASSGYDTEKVKGNLDAYSGLPGCCKYDHSMEMNQSIEANKEDHSGHNH